MQIENIDKSIIIASYENYYLICNQYNVTPYYYLGFPNEDNKIKFTGKLTIKTSINTLTDTIMKEDYKGIEELTQKEKNTQKGKDLIYLYGLIESKTENDAETILQELILTLTELIENPSDELWEHSLEQITDENVINKIKKLSEEITTEKNSKVILAKTSKGIITQFRDNPNVKDGLYEGTPKKDNKTGATTIEYNLIGNILIDNLILVYDKAGIVKDPIATITYKNTAINRTITIEKQPFEVIANHLVKNRLIDNTDKGIESLINKILVQGVNEHDFITAETDLLKDGFFMDMETNKVLSNNMFNNLKTTKEDVKNAVTLFNDIIKDRGTAIPNDCILFRFMLWSPFATVLKQMGITEGLYSMVLWGKSNTNKTGSSIMFSYLYTENKNTTLQKANTQSAIGTRLGESTLPLILDEAKDNLINPNDEEFNKNIVTDMIGRAVKDRANNETMLEFPALRLTVRTLNAPLEYKDEFLKRHRVLQYDGSMIVNKEDEKKFNIKYTPNAPNTKLKQLIHLGKAFSDRFIPYLENQSNELYDLDNLTIKILKQIEKDYNVSFNTNVMLPHTDRLTTQNNDITSIIRNKLNKLFTKAQKPFINNRQYGIIDFENCINNGAIVWLDYQPTNKLFIIKVKEFEKEISDITGEYMEIPEIMKLLDVNYDDNNGKNIKFKGNSTKAIKLSEYDLTYKLFNIRVREFEDIQAEAEEKQQREIEADRILNAKPIK